MNCIWVLVGEKPPLPRMWMDVVKEEFKCRLTTEGHVREGAHDWYSDFASMISLSGWCKTILIICWEQWGKYWGTLMMCCQTFSDISHSSVWEMPNASLPPRLASYRKREICLWSGNIYVCSAAPECNGTEDLEDTCVRPLFWTEK